MTSAAKQRAEATARARELHEVLTAIGTALPLRVIAAEMNKRKVPTPRGGEWHAASVSRAMQRIGLPVGIEIHNGDCRDILCQIGAGSIDCCVTSPPYFRLRDYQHPNQIGMEGDVSTYLKELVKVFRQVRRVLSDAGTLWIVVGDCWRDKDRLLLPARLALAMQKDGWVIRDEIIWHKSRATPAPVIDRTVAAHEVIYMFSKRPTGYHYNYLAIEEKAATPGAVRDYTSGKQKNAGKALLAPGYTPRVIIVRETRRKRSVWSIAPQQSLLPHFAMFPPKLAELCILAGCPAGGVVLDPFSGLGTTGLVALKKGRRAVLIEINKDYADLSRERIIRGK